jgi:hypothetical protein
VSGQQGPSTWGSKWLFLPMLAVYWLVLGSEKLRHWLRRGRGAS